MWVDCGGGAPLSRNLRANAAPRLDRRARAPNTEDLTGTAASALVEIRRRPSRSDPQRNAILERVDDCNALLCSSTMILSRPRPISLRLSGGSWRGPISQWRVRLSPTASSRWVWISTRRGASSAHRWGAGSVEPVSNGSGCNICRSALGGARSERERFDERLLPYGRLEDVDFQRTARGNRPDRAGRFVGNLTAMRDLDSTVLPGAVICPHAAYRRFSPRGAGIGGSCFPRDGWLACRARNAARSTKPPA